jgi:hypothetical protein
MNAVDRSRAAYVRQPGPYRAPRWLHEGFACYAEWLWSEVSRGLTAAQQVAKLGEGLKSLKGQFYLPADPVPLEDKARTKSEALERRKDNNVFGIFQRLGLESLPVPGGVAAELFFRAFDRLFGFPDCTQASRNHAGSSVDVDHPFADLPSLP